MDPTLIPNSPSILASRRARSLYGITISLIVMLILITSTIRFVTNNVPIYLFLFERYGVEEATGIPRTELSRISTEFQHYFSSDARYIDIAAEVHGVRRSLFSQDELLHMVDVKGLFQLVWAVQLASIILASCSGLLVIAAFRSAGVRIVVNSLAIGGMLAAGLTILFVIMSIVAFGPLFTLFHELGFRNDLWKLDPRTNLLVQIFPFGFWRAIAVITGGLILLESFILIAGSRAYLLLRMKR